MAFPPHKTLAAVPVPQSVALKYLSTFIAATKTTPYLIPSARLEPSGPTSGASSAPVQLANLERFEAGLRGEYLAPVLDWEEGHDGETAPLAAEDEGWQDLDQYQREQSIEEGDVEPRPTAIAQEGEENFEERVEVEVEGDRDAEEAGAPKAKKIKIKHEGTNGKSTKPVDMNAKKRAKKDRVKELKKQKRAEKAISKHAED